MINPKNIAVSACVGFFLSFFIGLVSDVRFSHVILRAFIFALVFAALCVGISFIYQKFLSNEGASFSVEQDPSAAKTAGSVVNIVVDDSALVDDGLTPKFTVTNNHATKPEKAAFVRSESAAVSPSVTSVQPEDSHAQPEAAQVQPLASSPSPAEASFKPVNLSEVSSGDAKEVAPSPAAQTEEVAPAEQLDELPDIGGMDAGETSDSSDSADEVVSDTEFATGGARLREQPISGDTNVMAKAIQTLLAQDNN